MISFVCFIVNWSTGSTLEKHYITYLHVRYSTYWFCQSLKSVWFKHCILQRYIHHVIATIVRTSTRRVDLVERLQSIGIVHTSSILPTSLLQSFKPQHGVLIWSKECKIDLVERLQGISIVYSSCVFTTSLRQSVEPQPQHGVLIWSKDSRT